MDLNAEGRRLHLYETLQCKRWSYLTWVIKNLPTEHRFLPTLSQVKHITLCVYIQKISILYVLNTNPTLHYTLYIEKFDSEIVKIKDKSETL